MRLLIELAASCHQHLFELFDVVGRLVCDTLAEEGPEMLRGLDLGRVGRLEDEVDSFGDDELLCGVARRLSSRMTMRFFSPAPTSSAKRLRAMFIMPAFILGRSNQTTRPELGWTKP